MAAEATTAESDPPLPRSLPDEILIWEIIARLPPKPLLRCRAVCRNWRRVTSTRDFLLAHHARQPTLPLICDYRTSAIEIIPFDHGAEADQLQAVAQLDDTVFGHIEASCDGLLILSDKDRRFYVCNPTTRQYAPLPPLDLEDDDDECRILGMYAHSPTGEYRLLIDLMLGYCDEDGLPVFNEDGFCVLTVGSADQPRQIRCPEACEHIGAPPVLFRGSLHWYTGQTITAFDTAAESFRQMCSPVASFDVGIWVWVLAHSLIQILLIFSTFDADMFESGGMLGMSSFDEREVTMDIWMMEDYQGEVWAFRHRIEFPSAELTTQFGEFQFQWNVVVPSSGGHISWLAKFGEWLLQIDVHGKMVASFHGEGLRLSSLPLKQTLLPHTFFDTLEGYVLNGPPFI